MRLSELFFTTLRDDPGRGRDAVAPAAAAGRLRPPARVGDLLAAAARLAGQQAGRAGHPRGAGPDRRPGDGDAGRPSGRGLEGERPLLQDRPGAGPVQGPRRARHGPRDDPRGGRRDPAPRHRPELPPAADDGLPLPDEVPRRAALARRPDPRPRVRHEGRLQLRPRRGRPRRELPRPVRGLRADLQAPRARRDRGRRRRRDHGRHRRPRVHGPQRLRRGHARPVRQLRLRREPADRRGPQARSGARGRPARWRTSRRPARRRSTRSRRSSASPQPDRQGRVLRDRRRPLRRRDRPRRLRRQRDEARQRGQGDRRAPAGHGRGDQGPRDGGRLRLADRGDATRSSSSTSSSCGRRTSSPARTASAGT